MECTCLDKVRSARLALLLRWMEVMASGQSLLTDHSTLGSRNCRGFCRYARTAGTNGKARIAGTFVIGTFQCTARVAFLLLRLPSA